MAGLTSILAVCLLLANPTFSAPLEEQPSEAVQEILLLEALNSTSAERNDNLSEFFRAIIQQSKFYINDDDEDDDEDGENDDVLLSADGDKEDDQEVSETDVNKLVNAIVDFFKVFLGGDDDDKNGTTVANDDANKQSTTPSPNDDVKKSTTTARVSDDDVKKSTAAARVSGDDVEENKNPTAGRSAEQLKTVRKEHVNELTKLFKELADYMRY